MDTTASGKTRLTHLDGLRALAALFVVFYNLWAQVWPKTAASFLYFGHFAVGVFIVLSGFCLMLPYVQQKTISLEGICHFFGRRLRRIIPTYYAALFLCLAFIHFFIGHKTGTHWDVALPVTWHGFVYHLLLLQDVYDAQEINYSLWSIALQWHLYLLFPLILLVWQRVGAWLTLAFTAFAAYDLHLTLQNAPDSSIAPQYLLLFVFGMLAASITFSTDAKWIATRQRAPWIILSCVAAGALVFMCSLLGFRKTASLQGWLDLLVGFSTVTLLVGTSIPPSSRLRRWLSWKPLVWIGGFSYSLYLVHGPLLQIIDRYFILPYQSRLSQWTMFLLLVGIGITIILSVSYLFFCAFERPFLNTATDRSLQTGNQIPREAKGQNIFAKSANIHVLLLLQFAAILTVAFPTLYSHFMDAHLPDMMLYYKTSMSLRLGQLAYRDFPLEYPPGALIAFYTPQIFSLGKALNIYFYICAFLVQSALLSTGIGLLLAYLTGKKFFTRLPINALTAYLILVTIITPLLPWRYDLFPAVLTLLSLCFLLRKQYLLSGIILGLGVAAKLYPIVLLPIFLAYLLVSKQKKASAQLAAGCFAVMLLSLVPFLHVLPKMMYLVHYHQQRGLELESVATGLFLIAGKLGLTHVGMVTNFGSCNITAPGAMSVAHLLSVVMVLVYGIVLWQCIQKFRSEQRSYGQVTSETLVTYILAALLAFILCNKVFSTQYIIWLLPFIPLMPRRQVALAAVVFALTMWIFPFDLGGLVQMDSLMIIVLNVRNGLLVFLLGWLIRNPARVSSAQPEQKLVIQAAA